MSEEGCQGYHDREGDFGCLYEAGWLDCSDCMFGGWGGKLDPRKSEEENET